MVGVDSSRLFYPDKIDSQFYPGEILPLAIGEVKSLIDLSLDRDDPWSVQHRGRCRYPSIPTGGSSHTRRRLEAEAERLTAGAER